MKTISTDVAIVGAGPAGATCGGFLKKYDPALRVHIFEREVFPRDHVGESLLPMVCNVLDELGVWDRVEACLFPVKIGGTYRWGNSDDLWDFNFLAKGKFEPAPRPAKFEGQRKFTAFQVDRSIYDKTLSDYAAELGCEVSYDAPVREVLQQDDRVTGLLLGEGTEVQAKYYVDASGHAGIIRRNMGVEVEEPSQLRNIAAWDYWRNAEWAVSLGVGGTRIQILSLGYGWLWFIPITEERTSVGFVCPVEYYKKSGSTMAEIYRQALDEEPLLKSLLANAECEHRFATTKDWSFVSARMSGENWFLAGEAQGFADPILSAGLTLTHASAREVAYIILEANRGGDLKWLREQYENRSSRRIRQHIKFADYWYSSNAHFSELQEFTAEIAREAGLEMDAESAFRWLGTGGFVEEDMEVAGLATLRLDFVHQVSQRLSQKPPVSALDGYNIFILNVQGAERIRTARFDKGRIVSGYALKRGAKVLPLSGLFGWVLEGLKRAPQLDSLVPFVIQSVEAGGQKVDRGIVVARLSETLEAMVRDGWVKAKYSEAYPAFKHEYPSETAAICTNIAGQ